VGKDIRTPQKKKNKNLRSKMQHEVQTALQKEIQNQQQVHANEIGEMTHRER